MGKHGLRQLPRGALEALGRAHGAIHLIVAKFWLRAHGESNGAALRSAGGVERGRKAGFKQILHTGDLSCRSERRAS